MPAHVRYTLFIYNILHFGISVVKMAKTGNEQIYNLAGINHFGGVDHRSASLFMCYS